MDTTWTALIIDDDPNIRQSVRLCLEADGCRVHGVGTSAAALEAIQRSHFDVVFLDLWLKSESGLTVLPEILRRQPGVSVIVITAFASYETAVEAMKAGAADYLPKPFTPDQIRNVARRVVAARVLKRQVTELRERLDETDQEALFDTHNSTYLAFLETGRRVAASDSVVVLRGESGTGKTLFARWLRANSRRAQRPFVTVHCPLLSSDLMSSTLFGHCKGAFTGAITDTVGKVEEAEGGTLLLDEVGDLSADAQARLLRFLNDRTYERLGEASERRADVRIIAATNRRLEEAVTAGRFREDLLFRLNVITLTLPPLRERPEDVLPFAEHYLSVFRRRHGRPRLEFSPRCKATMTAHSWPGNLRELHNAVERATILSPSDILEPQDLGLPATTTSADDPPPASDGTRRRTLPPVLGDEVSLEEIEREHLARVIARAPSFEAAARILGIDATTLQRKRKRYGLV